MVDVVSRFHNVPFLGGGNHNHSTVPFLFFFLPSLISLKKNESRVSGFSPSLWSVPQVIPETPERSCRICANVCFSKKIKAV